MPKKLKEVPPDTTRIVEGLRETGYTFKAAIADIIDNSLGVGAAETVMVSTGINAAGDPMVSVADDGCGMDLDGLENAMRYGAARQTDPNSLSKFGLGLKTASTGFCKRLVVVSRTAEMTQGGAAAWDIDEITKAQKWILEHDAADDLQQEALTLALDDLAVWSGREVGSGTLVKWEKVDRLLQTKQGRPAKNADIILKKQVKELSEHLEMVYQRFLDPKDVRERTVKIILNGAELKAWDPFAEGSGGEMMLEKALELTDEAGAKFSAKMRVFILSRKDEMDDEGAWKVMRVSLQRQGIYLYRENRLIDGPGWLGTGASETHINNLRVELSFDAQLDHWFGVGIKKSGVQIDQDLLEMITDVLSPLRREADRRARAGNAKKAATAGNGSKRPTDRTIDRVKGKLQIPGITTTAGGSVIMVNKTGEVPLVGDNGQPTGVIQISVDDDFADMNVVRRASLKDGVLWEGSLSKNNVLQVELNAGHDWYQKAYVPVAANSTMVQALEFLFYALAQAELDSTNSERREIFEDLRIDVSRNLRKLVADLPLPDVDEDE